MLRIIAIGKKHESWIDDGVRRYQKRLNGAWRVEWMLLPHSAADASRARLEESKAILAKLDPRDFVVLLDERGTSLDSPTLSRRLEQVIDASRPICIVIGGAYGVSEALMQRADLTWSLSPLVFPHQLVRLILIEQLYRAQQIAVGSPYHHM